MRSYEQMLQYIFNLRGGEIDLRLNRVEQALSLFGHPERTYPAFHIAGTNGKGSTAAMLHRILSGQGYRVALYTSPHVVSFTERIRVGEDEISKDEVVELAEEIRHALAKEELSLTFFEFVTVMALVYYSRCRVDVAVVEVGLGGRLDATNVVLPLVSMITTISKDHEAYLGSDLLSIAREKGGIIKNGVPVVCGSLRAEVAELLGEIAQRAGSNHYFLGRDFASVLREDGLFDYRGLEWDLKGLSLSLWGRHQRDNAAVALGALEIAGRDFPVSEAAVREGLSTVRWPGRFELLLGRPVVILDGAHNVEGMKALVQGVVDLQGSKKVKALFAAMEDKDWTSMIRELSRVASGIILTRVPMNRSADPRRIAERLDLGIPLTVVEDPRAALRCLLDRADSEETLVVTGSLYLLGEIRTLLCNTALERGEDAALPDAKL